MPDTDTILIVDDEIAIAALRVGVLPDAGYPVQMVPRPMQGEPCVRPASSATLRW